MYNIKMGNCGSIFSKLYTKSPPRDPNVNYHKNGIIEYDGEKINGKKHGLGISYRDTGIILYEGRWHNNKEKEMEHHIMKMVQ